MGGHVMARATTQTMSIISSAKRFDRRLREYFSGFVTARYLKNGRTNSIDITNPSTHSGTQYNYNMEIIAQVNGLSGGDDSPVHADGTQAEYGGGAKEYVERYPNIAKYPTETPRA